MRVPDLGKALGRAHHLSLPQLANLSGRRLRASLRAGAQRHDAARLQLRSDALTTLPRVVVGAHTLSEALAILDSSPGSLPVPAARQGEVLATLRARFPAAVDSLLATADRACAGTWQLLGLPQATLGRTPDWQGDFVAGKRWDHSAPSPTLPIVRGDGSDIKIPWELSRLQHLPAVAYAYALTGEPRYRELICEQLDDWIERNPPGLGVNWTCAMEVALRAISLSWAFELLRGDPAVPFSLRARVYFSLFAHGHFLRGQLEDGGVAIGNHYVSDLVGLLWLGALYPGFRGAAGWCTFAQARLTAHLSSQLRPDGGDDEASTTYHLLVAELVGLAAAILTANQRDARPLSEIFARMATFTKALLKPDGTAPQIGDNDGGRAFKLIEGAARAPLDQRPLVAWGLGQDDPEALLLGARARGPTPAPAPAAISLSSSGLTVFRHRDAYLLLAATPVGQRGAGGHGHNDKLALELSLGRDLIVDPGSFCYTSDPDARNRFRRTAAHATLQVDALEQNPITRDLFHLPERAHARVLRCERDGDGFCWEAEHSGFAPFVHRRLARVHLEARRLEITDSVLGPADREHTLTVRFPLAPDLTPTLDASGFQVSSLRLQVDGPAPQLSLERAAYSPNYGAQLECQVLVATAQTRLPASLRFHFTW